MTPIEAAVKAANERGYEGCEGPYVAPFDADDARAIITAFLEAAAEDDFAGEVLSLLAAYRAVRPGGEIIALRAKIVALTEALKTFRDYGCPVCQGDCSSANPPVICCPIQQADAALSKATGALP